jgi:hypothetical protein
MSFTQKLSDPKKRERSAYQKAYRDKNKERLKSAALFRTYGITLEQRDEMLRYQGGVCAICKSDSSSLGQLDWAVDHCHTTGRVRGILCHPCNTLLGAARDNQQILSNAINYLGT